MKALLAFLLLVAALASAQDCKGPSEYVATCYETVKVADGVFAFITPASPGGVVTGNSLLVVGRDSALLLDSGHFPGMTRKMLAEVRRLTDKPVRYLVNSHWHPDHNAGNGIVAEAYPGLAIVATAETREEFAKKVIKNADPAMYRGTVDAIRGMLRDGKFFDGSPLDASKRKYLETAQTEFEWMVPEVAGARHTTPNVTFARELNIDLGGRITRVFLGRGATAGDAIIYVPDAKVLATGDLVVYPVPYAHGCYPAEWVKTLAALEALDASVIVPGHGPVLRDKAYLKSVSALLTGLREQVSAGVAAGKQFRDLRSAVKFDAFLQSLPADPVWRIAFDSMFVGPATERAFREAKGERLEE